MGIKKEYYGLTEEEIKEMHARGEEFIENTENIVRQYAEKSDADAKVFYSHTKDKDLTFKYAGRKVLANRGLIEKRADGDWALTGK